MTGQRRAVHNIDRNYMMEMVHWRFGAGEPCGFGEGVEHFALGGVGRAVANLLAVGDSD